MSWPDYAIFAVIALSIIAGLWRGFIKEVFALAVWIAALWLAFQFSGALASQLEAHIELPSARTGLAFAAIFVAVLLVGALLTWLLGKLVQSTGLSGTDRVLGAVFGAIRGLALVLLLILACGFTPLPQDPWFQSSATIRALLPLTQWAAGFLPEAAAQHLRFEPLVEEQSA